MMNARWESPSRYYVAELRQDLLGDWVVDTARGGRRSNLGATRTQFVKSVEQGAKVMAAIHKLRTRHGYATVAPVSLPAGKRKGAGDGEGVRA